MHDINNICIICEFYLNNKYGKVNVLVYLGEDENIEPHIHITNIKLKHDDYDDIDICICLNKPNYFIHKESSNNIKSFEKDDLDILYMNLLKINHADEININWRTSLAMWNYFINDFEWVDDIPDYLSLNKNEYIYE